MFPWKGLLACPAVDCLWFCPVCIFTICVLLHPCESGFVSVSLGWFQFCLGLSCCLPVYYFLFLLFVRSFVCPCACLHIRLSACLFVCSFDYLIACLFVCLFACLFVCLLGWLVSWLLDWLLVCLSVCLFGSHDQLYISHFFLSFPWLFVRFVHFLPFLSLFLSFRPLPFFIS